MQRQYDAAMKSKSGFNLIEIAIVLAVIGLVIGGIYIAASAVNENFKQEKLQKQVLTIVNNVRTIYSDNRASAITTPSYAQLQILQIFPSDMPGDGVGFTNIYGGRTTLNFLGGVNFYVVLGTIPAQACIRLLVSMYGNSVATNSLWQSNAAYTGTGYLPLVSTITPAQAATICTTTANDLTMSFRF